MKIVNFGSCNIDYVYSLDHIVKIGETLNACKMEIFAGGKGLNQSVALAKAGAVVYHAGCIGSDGEFLKELMHNSGVDTSNIKTVDVKNGHAIIQVSIKGENSIFIHPGSNAMLTKDYIDSVLGGFTADDMILLQNEINEVDYIIEKAFEKSIPVAFNPSPINEKIHLIDFNKLSYLILNEVEAGDITGFSNVDDIINYFRTNYKSLKVVLTLGLSGSVYFDDKTKFYQPSFKVKAVDTTAAGDTFTGFFLSSVASGKSICVALKIASAASAIAVSKMGASPSIPDISYVLNSMGEFKENII